MFLENEPKSGVIFYPLQQKAPRRICRERRPCSTLSAIAKLFQFIHFETSKFGVGGKCSPDRILSKASFDMFFPFASLNCMSLSILAHQTESLVIGVKINNLILWPVCGRDKSSRKCVSPFAFKVACRESESLIKSYHL